MSHAWEDLIGERVRLYKGDETIEGTVAGPSPRSSASNDEHENGQPLWRIEVDGGGVKTVHPDDWRVETDGDDDGGAWGRPKL